MIFQKTHINKNPKDLYNPNNLNNLNAPNDFKDPNDLKDFNDPPNRRLPQDADYA